MKAAHMMLRAPQKAEGGAASREAVQNTTPSARIVATNSAPKPSMAHRRPRSTASSELRNALSCSSAILRLLVAGNVPAQLREAVRQSGFDRPERKLKDRRHIGERHLFL